MKSKEEKNMKADIDMELIKEAARKMREDPVMQKAVVEARKMIVGLQGRLSMAVGKRPEIDQMAMGCAACIICASCVITPGVPDAEFLAVTGNDLF